MHKHRHIKTENEIMDEENRDVEENSALGIEDSSDMNALIGTRPQDVKRCKYPSCNNEIQADSSFEYCEKCRTLAARNAIALVLDPAAPTALERSYEVTQTMLKNMTGDEILRFASRIEDVYLQTQKLIKILGISAATRKPFQSLEEQVDAARNTNKEQELTTKRLRAKSDKRLRQRATRIEKLQQLFPGMSETQIKKMMEETEDMIQTDFEGASGDDKKSSDIDGL